MLACAELGTTNTAMDARLGLSLMTVSKWRARYARLGLAGLGDVPRSGAPRLILDEHVAAVVSILEQLGYLRLQKIYRICIYHWVIRVVHR